MNCTQWQCRARDLRSGYRLSLTVEARLWTNSLIKEGFYGASISSVIIAQVTKLPYKPPKGFDLPIKHAVVCCLVLLSGLLIILQMYLTLAVHVSRSPLQ